MTELEERLRAEARRVAGRAREVAETDDAWAELQSAGDSVVPLSRRTRARAAARASRGWAGTAAAALLVVVGVGTTVFVRGDRDEAQPVASAPSSGDVAATSDVPTSATPATSSMTPSSVAPQPSLPAPRGTSLDDTTTSFSSGNVGPSCTYTDPARRPISVARALACPDGTSMWVKGVVVVGADGTRVLCAAVAADGTSCKGAGLRIIGGAGAGPAEFDGTKQGDQLVVHVARTASESGL